MALEIQDRPKKIEELNKLMGSQSYLLDNWITNGNSNSYISTSFRVKKHPDGIYK